MDPLRFAIAVVPLVAYSLLLAIVNLRRRPLVVHGGSDFAVLGAAIAGLVFVGPIELFRPEAAVAEYGNYVWLVLLLFYGLWIALITLLSRPRLVVYNISSEELHPILAAAASELDDQARWAGDSLALPGLGVQLHLDGFAVMRNVSLISSGSRQNLDGWKQLADKLGEKLQPVRVESNPRAVTFTLVAVLLLITSVGHMLSHPAELAEAIAQVWRY